VTSPSSSRSSLRQVVPTPRSNRCRPTPKEDGGNGKPQWIQRTPQFGERRSPSQLVQQSDVLRRLIYSTSFTEQIRQHCGESLADVARAQAAFPVEKVKAQGLRDSEKQAIAKHASVGLAVHGQRSEGDMLKVPLLSACTSQTPSSHVDELASVAKLCVRHVVKVALGNCALSLLKRLEASKIQLEETEHSLTRWQEQSLQIQRLNAKKLLLVRAKLSRRTVQLRSISCGRIDEEEEEDESCEEGAPASDDVEMVSSRADVALGQIVLQEQALLARDCGQSDIGTQGPQQILPGVVGTPQLADLDAVTSLSRSILEEMALLRSQSEELRRLEGTRSFARRAASHHKLAELPASQRRSSRQLLPASRARLRPQERLQRVFNARTPSCMIQPVTSGSGSASPSA